MKKLLLLFVVLLTTMGMQAQTTWTNDKAHTRIGFDIKHGGVSFVAGHFDDFDIKVTTSGKSYAGTKISVTVPTKSVNTRVEARNNHLRSADFFDVEKYPEMKFESTRFQVLSKTQAKVYGKLTLHGVTRPIVLNAQLIGMKPSPMNGQQTAGFRLTGTIKRTDFNFGPKFLPAMVGNEVKIIVDAEFSPAK